MIEAKEAAGIGAGGKLRHVDGEITVLGPRHIGLDETVSVTKVMPGAQVLNEEARVDEGRLLLDEAGSRVGAIGDCRGLSRDEEERLPLTA